MAGGWSRGLQYPIEGDSGGDGPDREHPPWTAMSPGIETSTLGRGRFAEECQRVHPTRSIGLNTHLFGGLGFSSVAWFDLIAWIAVIPLSLGSSWLELARLSVAVVVQERNTCLPSTRRPPPIR